MDLSLLTGQSRVHLQEIFPGHYLHKLVVEPYRQLVNLAEKAGFDLRLASGFRSFDRQLEIWNGKASGQQPVLDDSGVAIALTGLSDLDKVCAILRWSALPGASRHHWGTDVDIWDAAAVDRDYRPQLISKEYVSGGVFYPLSEWLDRVISCGETEFYRPYARDLGGTAPEPWHLSYRPVAREFNNSMDRPVLQEALNQDSIIFGDTVLSNLDEIYRRFVLPGID